ncbi:hypothetical protein [Marinobacter sp.]|uniref:hypothetical protein n=1 Tax=Marinobacter sp. TaxID=50741 RepID=UPI002580D18E|nr:hypothetical protein [Marinobacter sp.]|tara:strand:+ start:1685 stop:2314 length:630 start_codon:yes stop_codon:yes gene_type:complete
MSYLGQTPAAAPLNSNAIPDGLITVNKLSSNSVTEAKIVADAVTLTKIANASITAPKIANANVLTSEIQNDAVRSSKIAPLENLFEDASTVGTAFGANLSIDILDNSVVYSTAAASQNICVNLRGDGSTTLNNSMETGNTLTAAVLVTNTTNPFFISNTQIDGALVVPKVQGGSQLTAGNADSTDIYTITVVKTGSGAFTMFLSQSQFA